MGAAKDSEALMTLRGVGKFHGEKPALLDLDLSLSPGALLLLVGANGAGKSTLLALLAGLTRPSQGEIVRDVNESEIGYLGHRTFAYPRLSARENLAFWAGLGGLSLSRADIEAALSRVGLAEYADEPAGVFSRGMAQRLNLARVFLNRPRLLLLDEPSTGLDPASADMLRTEMIRARDAGTSVVLVSHHLASDLPLADTVLLLERGRAVFTGPAGIFDPARLWGGAAC